MKRMLLVLALLLLASPMVFAQTPQYRISRTVHICDYFDQGRLVPNTADDSAADSRWQGRILPTREPPFHKGKIQAVTGLLGKQGVPLSSPSATRKFCLRPLLHGTCVL